MRNFPLEKHPNALPAAIAAESAGEQGDFWAAHDALIQSAEIPPARIAALMVKQPLDRARYAQSSATTAKRRVASDLALAQSLGLNATPTFLLCCPDGKVLELTSLNQVDGYLK